VTAHRALLVAAHALALSLCASLVDAKPADAEPHVLSRLKALEAGATPLAAAVPISPVREAALRETAQALGVQAGLGEESRRIAAVINERAAQLDQRFRFNELLIGAGVLPPVISEAQDAFAVDGPIMRVAQRIYRIDEPARFVTSAPTWRSWLLVGLAPDLRPDPVQIQQLLPRDDQEKAFWRQTLDQAYSTGVAQARSIFELNLARMERTYFGMRRFFELHARGMVSKPEVIAADSVIDREDPNTVVVGSTVFRIVKHSDFVEEFRQWRPLGR
jgi:defect-in-organelle-trafficking protein DotC